MQSSTSLSAAVWTRLGNAVQPLTGTATVANFVSTNAAVQFLRVQKIP